MDKINAKILSILQADGAISMSALSERVGLSLSACHRRVRNLESNGTIRKYSAVLDPKAIGLEMHVFLEIKLISQQRRHYQAFEESIQTMPEVLECHMISGDFDYLVRVAAKGAEDYEALYRKRLSEIPSVAQMRTLLNLSTIKAFDGYHLH